MFAVILHQKSTQYLENHILSKHFKIIVIMKKLLFFFAAMVIVSLSAQALYIINEEETETETTETVVTDSTSSNKGHHHGWKHGKDSVKHSKDSVKIHFKDSVCTGKGKHHRDSLNLDGDSVRHHGWAKDSIKGRGHHNHHGWKHHKDSVVEEEPVVTPEETEEPVVTPEETEEVASESNSRQATGINGVQTFIGNRRSFNLNGQRVALPVRGQLYISEGRKMIKK